MLVSLKHNHKRGKKKKQHLFFLKIDIIRLKGGKKLQRGKLQNFKFLFQIKKKYLRA